MVVIPQAGAPMCITAIVKPSCNLVQYLVHRIRKMRIVQILNVRLTCPSISDEKLISFDLYTNTITG